MHDLWHFKLPSQRGGGSGMLYCQAWGQDHDQVNSRKLQGIKKLLVILKSQGLDLQIDSIIGIYHHPPTTIKLFGVSKNFLEYTRTFPNIPPSSPPPYQTIPNHTKPMMIANGLVPITNCKLPMTK